MPISPDAITRKKLILVKQLYQQAVVQSASQHSIVSRILSVIGFDLTVETLLRAIVSSLAPSKTPADGFQGLIQQCDSLLKERGNHIPDKTNIRYIHSIRNDAQHKAKYPNESDVNDCRTYCRDFLKKVIDDVWGLDFDGISLTDSIQNERVRQFLTEAETAFDQGDYQQAIHKAAAGLTWALDRVSIAVVGRLPPFTRANPVADAFADLDAQDIRQTLERMQETLLYVALGMNYADFMEYKRIAGQVFFALDGNPHYAGGKGNPDANDAEFVIIYCTDTVAQIESRVGSLEAPFGSDRWY